MDWAGAIDRNSEVLKAIVAGLFAMLGLVSGATVARIPRPLHRAVLSVLRPAESAARRLIVIAARGLAVTLAPARAMPAGPIGRGGCLSFQLFDPRKRFAARRCRPGPSVAPRIHSFGGDPRVTALWPAPPRSEPLPPPDDGLIDAQRLSQRLEALKRALEDLPRQARRLVRLRARRETVPELKFKSPLRPGHPPGHRGIPVHDIDYVLAECHALARDALEPDTS